MSALITAYMVEVIADSSGKWIGNSLVFQTRALAEQYAIDLEMRWTLVREWRVVETQVDPITTTFDDASPRPTRVRL